MMYPYMTLEDDTEITHSEMGSDGRVKVYIETPDEEGGFHYATCYLPDYTWENCGYSNTELESLKKFVRNNAHLIMEFSQSGGFKNAANSGKTFLANNNSHIPQNDLGRLLRMIEANSEMIVDEWYQLYFTGSINWTMLMYQKK